MRSAINSRRGMTLAELMVALGLVAIMITMVVSFSLLLSERTRANTENLNLQQDLSMIRSGVEGWLGEVTKLDATLSLQAGTGTKLEETPEGEGSWKITTPIDSNPNDEIDELRTSVTAIVEELGDPAEELSLTLSFTYGILKGELPDGREITIRTESVKAVNFYLAEKTVDGETEYLLYCIVTGEDIGHGEETYRFCIDPRVGEKGGT